MDTRSVLLCLFGVVGLLSTACMTSMPTTGIVKLSADTYRLSRVDPGGQYPDAAAMRAAVIDEADSFAKGQGKIALPISTHEETMRVGHLTTIDYEFRLASLGEPLPSQVTMPTAVSDAAKPALSPAAPPKPSQTMPVDLYNELLRLDDLRKRGILTDEEFQILKNRLIAGH